VACAGCGASSKRRAKSCAASWAPNRRWPIWPGAWAPTKRGSNGRSSASSTIESTSPLANVESMDASTLPAVLVPSEPPAPDRLFEQGEVRDRVRGALASLPARERRIIALYYFGEATMKQMARKLA
jgi:RNA polymerase sigma factor (sigma-70 family)